MDAEAGSAARATRALVDELVRAFREQVRRAIGVDLDGSVTSLAFVDHYLSLARSETREPILSLLAAGAGAYYGELVARELGATWIGDGADPRKLRLLLRHQFVHFCPVDQAFEAIIGTTLAADDPRAPAGPALDASFHPRPRTSDADDEAAWLEARLAELAPVPEDQFHSLTGRFETLQLVLELLAGRQAAAGDEAREYAVDDYVAALADAATPQE